MIDFSNKVSIFRDEELSEQFQRDGYVRVSFLNEEDIGTLEAIYSRLYPDGVKGFFSTTFAQNPAHRAEVNREVNRICKKRMNELFRDYKTFFSSFIAKAPGEDSELALHQDMTLVDERVYIGMNIWCPLLDLNGENGQLHLLPGSHRIFFTYRGSSLPDIYDDVKQVTISYLQPLDLAAGEAVIFDQSIIHYSPPNLSDIERVVINTFVAHKDAEIRICYHNKEEAPDQVEVFAQEDNFIEEYMNFGANIFDRPRIGQSLGFVDFDFPKLSAEKLAELYAVKEVPKNGMLNWFKRQFA